MLHDVLDPPARVQPAADRAGLLSLCRDLAAQIGREERMTLMTALDLGKALTHLHAVTPYGKWGETLEALNLPRTTAWEYQLIATCSAPNKSSWRSIREAVEAAKALQQPSEDAEPDDQAAAGDNGDGTDAPAAGKKGKGGKPDPAKTVARMLIKHHARTDAEIAAKVGCKQKVVEVVRRDLVARGRIPAQMPAQPELPLDPEEVEAKRIARIEAEAKEATRRALAEARDLVGDLHDRLKQLLRGPLGDALRARGKFVPAFFTRTDGTEQSASRHTSPVLDKLAEMLAEVAAQAAGQGATRDP